MKTEIQNGVLVLTCSHAEKFNAARTLRPGPEAFVGAAPVRECIELEAGVVFMCCSFCAAHIQQKALEAMVKQGVKVTLEPAPKDGTQNTII